MASYRFSASIIGRSAGRSITAAAAYRAACELTCARYGEHHDYTRKQGVVHSEILMPPIAPAHLRDRATLWNAVEAAERRKDAQLAREVQLSLPHELTPAQRRDLVRSFVSDHFVSHGMIADVSIHAPHRDGDGRNHHAHVLLTMRQVTGEGFGKKVRDWNAPKQLEAWREAWAHHQNQAFQRLGLSVRVDHRSLEGQGIDRAPQQHRGAKATAMERRGEATRIGDKNRAIDRQNAARTERAAALKTIEARLAKQWARFQDWKDHVRDGLSIQHRRAHYNMISRQSDQAQALEQRLKDRYGVTMNQTAREAETLKARLSQKGLRGFVRKITGAQARDAQAYHVHQQTLARVNQAITQQRRGLAQQHEGEQVSLHRDQVYQVKVQESKLAATERRKDEVLRSAFMDDYNAAIDKAHEGQREATDDTRLTNERERSRVRRITHGLDR